MTQPELSLALDLEHSQFLGIVRTGPQDASSRLFVVPKAGSNDRKVLYLAQYSGETSTDEAAKASEISGVAELIETEPPTLHVDVFNSRLSKRAVAALAIEASDMLPCDPNEVTVELNMPPNIPLTPQRVVDLIHMRANAA